MNPILLACLGMAIPVRQQLLRVDLMLLGADVEDEARRWLRDAERLI